MLTVNDYTLLKSVRARDLITLPCSHPDCCSIGYFIKGKGGSYDGLASIVGEDALRDNLSLFGNTISFSDSLGAIRDALFGIMSETMTLSRPQLIDHLRTLCSTCDLRTRSRSRKRSRSHAVLRGTLVSQSAPSRTGRHRTACGESHRPRTMREEESLTNDDGSQSRYYRYRRQLLSDKRS